MLGLKLGFVSRQNECVLSVSNIYLMRLPFLKIQSCFRICFIEFVNGNGLKDTNSAVLLHFMLLTQKFRLSCRMGQRFFHEFSSLVPILCSFLSG